MSASEAVLRAMQEHRGALYSTLRAKRVPHDQAEDIAQEVWANLLTYHKGGALTRQMVLACAKQRLWRAALRHKTGKKLAEHLTITGGEYLGASPSCIMCDRPRGVGNLCHMHHKRKTRGQDMVNGPSKTRRCEQCGEKLAANAHGGTRYCSTRCRRDAENDKRRAA